MIPAALAAANGADPTMMPRMGTRRRSSRLLLAAGSVVLAVACAEAIARALDPAPTVVVALRRELLYGRIDPDLGWSPLPDLDRFRVREVGLEGEVILDYHVSTNSRGLRGRREYAAPRPPGGRRIVALGDSFTWGQSVEEEETFPARLEARGVEVPNLGVIGYGPGQMLLRLRRDGLPLEPDVVMLCLISDDVRRDVEPWNVNGCARPCFSLVDGALAPPRYPLPPRLPGGTVIPNPHHGLARVLRGAQSALGLGPRWDLLRATVLEIRREALAAGARFVVVVLPFLADPGDRLAQVLGDLGRAHDFQVVDARPAFDARPDKTSLFIIDGHPDAAGHALIADEIARQAPWLLEATPGR